MLFKHFSNNRMWCVCFFVGHLIVREIKIAIFSVWIRKFNVCVCVFVRMKFVCILVCWPQKKNSPKYCLMNYTISFRIFFCLLVFTSDKFRAKFDPLIQWKRKKSHVHTLTHIWEEWFCISSKIPKPLWRYFRRILVVDMEK